MFKARYQFIYRLTYAKGRAGCSSSNVQAFTVSQPLH